MPHTATVVHALAATGAERSQRADIKGVAGEADNDEPLCVAQGIEGLRPERMPLDHLDLDRVRTGLAAKYADQRHTVFRADIDTREVVKPFGRALVNREMPSTVGFDDVSERGKGFAGQPRGKQLERVQG